MMCIFPAQLFEPTECGNGYVEVGEECDCGVRAVSHWFAIIIKFELFQVKVSYPDNNWLFTACGGAVIN